MKNYIRQDGCHNCTKCKNYWDYGRGDMYICTALNKMPKEDDFNSWDTYYEVFAKWERKNKVDPWGKCDSYKRSKF